MASMSEQERRRFLLDTVGRIGARYLGVDETDHLAELNGGPGNLLVRVTPTHIISENSITELSP